MDQNGSGIKTFLVSLVLFLLSVTVFGLVWFFFLGPTTPVGFGWYLFSFTSGLTMIVLACTLPLVFVIVPLSLGKSPLKGVVIALAFGLGVAITLSFYGIIAAVVGKVAINSLGAPLELVKNWLYFIAGLFAYLFALGEIGLINFRMPTYSGAAPAFIQKQQDVLRALILGLFLGNIGVGCPHPATPVILTRIAVAGDVFHGWLLFLVHALGRITPLLIVAFLGILGVSALNWLIARKEKLERATGWGMVFVAAFILVLGLFTHDWWVYSGQHTLFEAVTQEEQVLGAVAKRLGAAPPHVHEIPTGTGLFNLPLWLGNWTLVFLWIIPLWIFYIKKRENFWGILALSLLLGTLVIYALPDWFLYHLHQQPKAIGQMMAHEEEHSVLLHEEQEVADGIVVNLNVTPPSVMTASSTRLSFFVNEKPWQVPVINLEIDHEKFMHVIGVRDDLNQFFHIHPAPSSTPGYLEVDYVFNQPGNYKIWSEVKRSDVGHIFGHPLITATGVGTTSQKEVSLARNVIVDNYQIKLTLPEPVTQKTATDLAFDIRTLTNQPVVLENYLGAKMHLSIIKDDLKQFIHTHPAGHDEGDDDNHHGLNLIKKALAHSDTAASVADQKQVSFHVTFPEAGLYKAFAQFRPAGSPLLPDNALIAGFWIEVVDRPAPSAPVSASTPLQLSKVTLTVISLIFIVLLSWIVKQLIKPKV